MRSRLFNGELIMALAVFAFLAYFTVQSFDFSRDARLFPLLAGIMGLSACGSVIFKIMRDLVAGAPAKAAGEKVKDERPWGERNGFWIILAGIACFVVGIHILGYVLSSLIYMAATMWLLGYKRPLQLVSITVLVVAGVYLAFGYGLKVPIPMGILFN